MYYMSKTAGWMANHVDTDQTPRSAASDQCLHCLRKPVRLNLVCYCGFIRNHWNICLQRKKQCQWETNYIFKFAFLLHVLGFDKINLSELSKGLQVVKPEKFLTEIACLNFYFYLFIFFFFGVKLTDCMKYWPNKFKYFDTFSTNFQKVYIQSSLHLQF